MGPIETVYLGEPVEGLLELQVLPGLAGQVHPFAFEPLHSGFTQKVFGLHLGDEVNVSALDVRRNKRVFMTRRTNRTSARLHASLSARWPTVIPLSRIIGVCPSEPPAQKDLANLNELATEILTANQGTKC